MTRSIKNTFAPINRIPPEVLSLIPDYRDVERDLVTLTHVCCAWREIFISRASLWTSLDCINPDRTGVYVQRSRGAPLEICLDVPDDALLMTLPLIGRLKALKLLGFSQDVLRLTEHFSSPAPLLEKLEIDVLGYYPAAVKNTLFDGNLSSLRELSLQGVFTNLPWQNLSNLTTFDFRRVPSDAVSVTQLLDLFLRAPLLREIKLGESLPSSSDAPTERVVSLPHLRLLRIYTKSMHSTLLNHLHIPTGALMTLEFWFGGESSPIPYFLPRSIDNLNNISHITSINLDFRSGVAMRLKGPSGGLYMFGTWDDANSARNILDCRILRSLKKFHISTTERLAIAQCDAPVRSKTENSGAYQTLHLMNNLRTLVLTDCLNHSFIFALNPDRNASNMVVCPELEEVVLHIREQREGSCIDGLLEMAKERASRGAKLSTVVIVCPREYIPVEKVFDLRSYVPYVDYRLDDTTPRWDILPGEADEASYDGDW